MNSISVFIVLFTIAVKCVLSYRILCPYPTISRSHFIVADALFKGLAAKGHAVTVISAFPPENPIPNYRHILQPHVHRDGLMKFFEEDPGERGFSLDLFKALPRVIVDESRGMIANPEVQKIMDAETFDLIIMEFMGEPHIGLAAHFNCPVILFTSVKPTYRLLEFVGNPLALSYVTNTIFPMTDLKRFQDRLINFVFYLSDIVFCEYFAHQYRAFHDEIFPPPKYPPFNEVFKNNVAALFTAHHFSQGDVRPIVPGLIEISGIHINETGSPLPYALQKWMDESINGVVYFSLGSNLKVSLLTTNRLEAIIYVFKSLEQNILWKSDVAIIPGLPDNVRLESWVSQVDVLRHKNTKLFITHGGFGSVTESKFFRVPVLVIPMFADQIPNANQIVDEGWGIKLPYQEFNKERFDSSVREVLGNPKYYSYAKYESMLFRDRPITPLQTGVYWAEYIMRHKGALHMRSNAKEMNLLQLHSIDVIGFLTAIFFVWAFISYKILKCLVQKLLGGKKSKVKIN